MLHRNCKKKKERNKRKTFFFFLLAPTPQWTQILFTVTFTFLRSLQVLPRPCCCRIAGVLGAGCCGDQPGKKRGRMQLVGSLQRFAATLVTLRG